jgi:hypothetical protein
LEGSTLVMLTLLRFGGSIVEEIPILVKDVKTSIANSQSPSVLAAVLRVGEEKCVEAMAMYSKNIALCGLEVECSLRLAKMHEQYNTGPEKHQKVLNLLFLHEHLFQPYQPIHLYIRCVCLYKSA